MQLGVAPTPRPGPGGMREALTIHDDSVGDLQHITAHRKKQPPTADRFDARTSGKGDSEGLVHDSVEVAAACPGCGAIG